MPQYLAPGVYVEEISTGPKPIEGVSTSVAGFLGPTERGPESVQLLTSWLAFQRWYGSYLDPAVSFLAYAVQGFFDNGGKRCYIARVAGSGAGLATGALGNLGLFALGRGEWGNRIYVMVDKATKAKSDTTGKAKDWFRITLLYYRTPPATPMDPRIAKNVQDPAFVPPDVFEDFDNLSSVKGASNNVVMALNSGSYLVRVSWNDAGPAPLTANGGFVKVMAGGADANITVGDYSGGLDAIGGPLVKNDLLGKGTGFAAMAAVKGVSLLLAPDHVLLGDDLLNMVVAQCETLRDRFAVLSADRGLPDAVNKGNPRPSADTNFGAQYYPWITVYDPVTRDDLLVPPAGHVAGLIARIDIDQGVHKAPANAVVAGAKGLQNPVSKENQESLNPVGINCIRDFRSDGRGIRVWGARTMTSDPEWKYVNVRRLFLFVEQSIDAGTQWVVFEPNSDPTWARVVRTITAFLVNVWRSGALMGTTQDQAFFVKCDRTTMTQDDIDNGRLICYIGIAPVKPAEFVIFRIGQKTADAPS